jgi:hypothetical protein
MFLHFDGVLLKALNDMKAGLRTSYPEVTDIKLSARISGSHLEAEFAKNEDRDQFYKTFWGLWRFKFECLPLDNIS